MTTTYHTPVFVYGTLMREHALHVLTEKCLLPTLPVLPARKRGRLFWHPEGGGYPVLVNPGTYLLRYGAETLTIPDDEYVVGEWQAWADNSAADYIIGMEVKAGYCAEWTRADVTIGTDEFRPDVPIREQREVLTFPYVPDERLSLADFQRVPGNSWHTTTRTRYLAPT